VSSQWKLETLLTADVGAMTTIEYGSPNGDLPRGKSYPVAKGGIECLWPICVPLRAIRNPVAKGTETLDRFCVPLCATRNPVAKGGIEPPTQGFSDLRRQYDGLRPGPPGYDYLNIFSSLSYTEFDWPFLDFRSAIY
jgi:hypothetical protein